MTLEILLGVPIIIVAFKNIVYKHVFRVAKTAIEMLINR